MAVSAAAEAIITRLNLEASAPPPPAQRSVWHRLARLIAARVD
jgi:hypothetical protein